MSNKTAIVLQSYGIGDCLYAQGVIKYIIGRGYKIIWPVRPHYVEGLNRAYPYVSFMPDSYIKQEIFNIKAPIDKDGAMIVPIRWANEIEGVPYKNVMRAKYDMYKLDWTKWREDAMWERDYMRESKLFYECGLTTNKKYILVNRYWGSESQYQADIPRFNETDFVVDMKTIEGYSLFDWAMVIENATYIHTANTSILYLLETLDLAAKEIHLYARKPIEPNFENVKELFSKNYILHL